MLGAIVLPAVRSDNCPIILLGYRVETQKELQRITKYEHALTVMWGTGGPTHFSKSK